MGGGNDSYVSSNSNQGAEGDFIVRALHEYHTDSVGHLSFAQFQYIKVIHCEESGWWLGESESNRGWFPSNRVERVDPVYETEYLSRPTSITSEDYDQIRTGLDGVETQFLGEPVSESIADSMHLDWAAKTTRAGSLAFPPSHLSVPQPFFGPELSSTDMENDMFYHHTISSTTSLNNSDISYAYSDFVAEVTLYVDELRESISRGDIDRYQPIVANIISCVKALLVFTNTIARESEVLQTYPELARSRRIILRALGKLYSKCRVANGSQALTTTRQRQYAVEKLGIFAGQVLGGIADFATRACEIGLRIRAEHSPAPAIGGGDLDMVLMASGEVETASIAGTVTSAGSSSYGRPRRRVSRANSAKGFKSFNAVRQLKTEHTQKHNAARKAVELMLAEYMDCLNGPAGLATLNDILKMTIQTGQTVDKFLASAEEMKARTNIKEDQDYTSQKVLLMVTLSDLFGFIQTLEGTASGSGHWTDTILNRFVSLTSVMLKCLINMEAIPKTGGFSTQAAQESVPSSNNKRVSFSQEQESQKLQESPVSRTTTPEPTMLSNEFMEGQSYHLTDSPVAEVVDNDNSDFPKSSYSSRNTTPARAKQQGNVVPLSRKFISMTSMNDRYKRQLSGGQHPLERESSTANLETAAYGEAHDLERNQTDFYRSTHHDSAVVMSAKNTPHHSLMGGQKGPTSRIPIAAEDAEEPKPQSVGGPQKQDPLVNEEKEAEKPNEAEPIDELHGAIRDAERKIAAIFMPAMPTMARAQISQEIIAPAVCVLQTDTSPHDRNDRTQQQDAGTPATPDLRPQLMSESKPPAASSRTARTTKTTTDGNSSRTYGTRQARNPASRPPVEINGPAEDSDIVGLGVSTPSGTHPRNSSSSTISSQTTSSLSRASGTPSARSAGRNAIPPSPRLDSSRRMPRSSENLIHPLSPNLSAEGASNRASSRMGGAIAHNSLSPAVMSGSRRGSEHSIRSEASSRRKSNDSQSLRENDPRYDYQERRQPSSQSGPRRSSKTSMSTTPSPRMGPHNTSREDDLTSGPSTPGSSYIMSFQDGRQSPRRPAKSNRRESVQSNLSVGTESSVHSRTGGSLRPVSPALRGRNHNSADSSIKGRLSSESNISSNDKQHYHQQQQPQPTRGVANSSGYRPRPNRVGQAKTRTSGEHKREPTPVPAVTPWFLENDYESDEVLYNESGNLVAATLHAYIEMLTSHKNTLDAAFTSTFFITFRLFTSPVELVSLLIKRFTKPQPSGLSDFEQLMWAQQKQERVQKRVHLAIRTWLENYWVTEKDREAFPPIMDFVTHEMMEALPGPAGRLLDMLNQWANKRRSLGFNSRAHAISKARSHDRLGQTAHDFNADNSQSNGGNSHNSKLFSTVKDKSLGDHLKNNRKGITSAFGGTTGEGPNGRGPPVPLVNKALLNALSSDLTLAKVPVTDIKPVELARQLTIMFGRLYANIPYLELLEKERPNCSKMAQISNKIIIWVTDTIVDEQDVKKRISVVKHWIEVGEECLKLNNYDTLFAISSAIESTPVKRLYNTWEGINKAYFDRSTQLRKIVSNELNYSVYRARLKTVQAPCIPFLGIYLTTITYIEDGNSTYKEPNPNPPAGASTETPQNVVSTRKLLRYGRFFQLAKAVQELRGFQGSYELLEVPRLRDYIMKCIEDQDSERSYRKSLAIEPRRPAPNHIPPTPGGGHGTSGGQRSSGGGKGLFHGGITNSDVNNSVPTKLNKLSFFRKSARSERS